MNSTLKKYFFFLIPCLLCMFYRDCYEAFAVPEDTLFGTSYTPRLSGLEDLLGVLFFIGLYELAKHSRDKFVTAFAVLDVLFYLFPSLMGLIFGAIADYSDVYSYAYAGLSLARIILIACFIIRLYRSNHKKEAKYFILAYVLAFIAIGVIRSETTLPSALFLNILNDLVAPYTALWLYLRYRVSPKLEA